MDFLDRVDELIKKNKTTKKELANFAGFSTQSFYDWEKRNTIPSAETVCKIAEYLGTSVEYLVNGSEKDIYKEKYDNILKDLQTVLDKYK